MTPEEFVIWLRGFVAASSHYNLTPAGWEDLNEQLKKVKQRSYVKRNIDIWNVCHYLILGR